MENLSGRKAQAARNDEAILAAAREVFVANPAAPISDVAARAGVGISALYRRYESKEALLATLCANGLRTYNTLTVAALDALDDPSDERSPWELYRDHLLALVAADTSSLTISLAGTFTPTKEIADLGVELADVGPRLFDRVAATGALRDDVTFVDIGILLELIASLKIEGEERKAELRERYLALILDGVQAPAATPLPNSPPSWEEQSARWVPKQ